MSTRKPKWPIYTSHDEASCFNCGGDFGDRGYPMRSDRPETDGAWFQCCSKCSMTTHYDLAEPTIRETVAALMDAEIEEGLGG